MTNALFVAVIAIVMAAIFLWGFRRLPDEGWQMIASVPMRKHADGHWQGLNLTYYGFFNATAMAFACTMVLILMSSIQASLRATVAVLTMGLLIALPMARIVARIVEGKRHTFTVGGAAFILIIVLPWLIGLFNSIVGEPLGLSLPPRPMLAAIVIAYAFGEALGRLACISFGCCYGQALTQLPPFFATLLRRFSFVFTGQTKKVSYEGRLAGKPVVAIQALTSIVFAVGGLVGVLLFLESRWLGALVVPLAVTQLWRVASETLRADFRGGRRISAYQVMAILGLLYGLAMLPFVGQAASSTPNLAYATRIFSNGWLLILIQLEWLLVFLYLGRSSVTTSRVSFWVMPDRV